MLLLGDIWQGHLVHKLFIGATYQLNYVLRANIERHRVDGMILYSPARRISAFYEPTLIVMSGVNVTDRNRAGQPYLLIMLRSGFEI